MSIGEWLRWYERWTLAFRRGDSIIEYPQTAFLELTQHLELLKLRRDGRYADV